MSFEILDKDLLGRIGKLNTKQGIVETPLLLPVINPQVQLISPRELERMFECRALITNAYLLKKNFGEIVKTKGIHLFLDFDGVVMTDSGAYQILVYGDVDVSPIEIAGFEEEIDPDIAVVLDVPTGWNLTKEKARYTVEETLRRARLTLNTLQKKNILWVGPIQGGNHLDLVAYSATEIAKMPFQIYALGSPTQVMERYLFDVLVDMIITTKKNIPLNKPLHLFGAGHPFMFVFAVALGCDLFDSAAYALYARHNKYMTNYGTFRLNHLKYFPCSCGVCSKYSPQDLREMSQEERENALARHNLAVSFAEIRRIKQAIREGRLWELLELRSRSHPSLLTALQRLSIHQDFLEAHSPLFKDRGLFFFDSVSLIRPQILRHHTRLKDWKPQRDYQILMLLPQTTSKPFHKSREIQRVLKVMRDEKCDLNRIHICVYGPPFGLVPLELDEVYPFSQFEVSYPIDIETKIHIISIVTDYIMKCNHGYKAVVLYSAENESLGKLLIKECDNACKKTDLLFFPSMSKGKTWGKDSIKCLVSLIVSAMKSINSQEMINFE